jgi:hypothetical protein
VTAKSRHRPPRVPIDPERAARILRLTARVAYQLPVNTADPPPSRQGRAVAATIWAGLVARGWRRCGRCGYLRSPRRHTCRPAPWPWSRYFIHIDDATTPIREGPRLVMTRLAEGFRMLAGRSPFDRIPVADDADPVDRGRAREGILPVLDQRHPPDNSIVEAGWRAESRRIGFLRSAQDEAIRALARAAGGIGRPWSPVDPPGPRCRIIGFVHRGADVVDVSLGMWVFPMTTNVHAILDRVRIEIDRRFGARSAFDYDLLEPAEDD